LKPGKALSMRMVHPPPHPGRSRIEMPGCLPASWFDLYERTENLSRPRFVGSSEGPAEPPNRCFPDKPRVRNRFEPMALKAES